MKRILSIILTVALTIGLTTCITTGTATGGGNSSAAQQTGTYNTPKTPQAFNDITATELVAKIKIGWCLGNTFDAAGGETAWGNPKTTKENITGLKKAGFNAIRIPVSWTNGLDSSYNIRESWMARVVDVVNYAVDNDMYIILNTHHDERIFKFMNSNAAAGQVAFKKIWEQIAATFQNYNEKLIFEGLNEPRTKDSAAEWTGGTAEEWNNVNAYYPIFVKAVRESGGNNDKRFLLINAYAASAEASAMNNLVLPEDTAKNKLIVSYHSYSPYNFALNTGSGKTDKWSEFNANDKRDVTSHIDRYYYKFVSKGIPVIIGEFGAMNRNNAAVRAEWAEFYVGYARSKGIPCFWWDNGVTSGSGELFGLYNRRSNTISYPEIVTAMMKAANSSGE